MLLEMYEYIKSYGFILGYVHSFSYTLQYKNLCQSLTEESCICTFRSPPMLYFIIGRIARVVLYINKFLATQHNHKHTIVL